MVVMPTFPSGNKGNFYGDTEDTNGVTVWEERYNRGDDEEMEKMPMFYALRWSLIDSQRPRLFQFPNPSMKIFLSQFLPQMPLLVVVHGGFPRDTILKVPSLQLLDLTSLYQRQQQQSTPSAICSWIILPATSPRSLGAWTGVRRDG